MKKHKLPNLLAFHKSFLYKKWKDFFLCQNWNRRIINSKSVVIFFQSDDSDIWDDTALIKAYDKAVASFKVH